jgi:hypothetical protein
MIAFGTAPQITDAHGYRTIPLSHVLGFLREYLRSYWDVLRHAQLKDPTLGFLAMLEKAQRSG